MSSFRRWPWAVLTLAGCLTVIGCNGGPGAAGTPGNGAQPPPATGEPTADAQVSPGTGSSAPGGNPGASGKSGGGSAGSEGSGGGGGNGSGGSGGGGGGGVASGAPIHIPFVLLNDSGQHTVQVGLNDAIGRLVRQCGPSRCHVTIVTEGALDSCIGHLEVSPPGTNDPAKGVTVYPGGTLTIVGGTPCPDSTPTPSPSDTGPVVQASPSDAPSP
jgi:hypothetical protein